MHTTMKDNQYYLQIYTKKNYLICPVPMKNTYIAACNNGQFIK